jgi:hypothetical protein
METSPEASFFCSPQRRNRRREGLPRWYWKYYNKNRKVIKSRGYMAFHKTQEAPLELYRYVTLYNYKLASPMEIFKNDMSFPSKFISEKLKSRLDGLPR